MTDPGYQVQDSQRQFDGSIISVRTDTVAMADGRTAQRDVVEHPGAVGVVALDGAGRVLLLRQYRHPVGRHLWELPAGILDVDGEAACAAAARELGEEADVTATDWRVLVDALTSPGMTDEAVRIFLARGIGAVAEADRHDREGEEAGMTVEWVPLADAVERVLAGDVQNAMAVMGLLAAVTASRTDPPYDGLRPASATWAARPGHSG